MGMLVIVCGRDAGGGAVDGIVRCMLAYCSAFLVYWFYLTVVGGAGRNSFRYLATGVYCILFLLGCK